MKILVIALIALASFALSAQTAHAQVGLTVAQCEAKLGKADVNHGTAPHWSRHAFGREFTMSVFGDGDSVDGNDGKPIKHIAYISNDRYPLPIGKILAENFPNPNPEFVFHIRSWVSVESDGQRYNLVIDMDSDFSD